MTGVTLKINFETQALRQTLTRLKQNAESLRPALTEIGEVLLEATEDRFAEQVDSAGVFPAYAGIDQTLNPAGLVKLIGEVSGHWIEAVCIGTGLDCETLDAETVEVLVQLTARVIEVNADFLVREALPVFEEAVGRLAEMSSAASEAGSSVYSPEVLN